MARQSYKKKQRKKKKKSKNERNLVLAEEFQYYAKVIKVEGGSRVRCFVIFNDKVKKKLCIIPGKLRNRVWIVKNDWLLVSVRVMGYGENYTKQEKLDIIHKYNDDEVKKLIKRQEIVDINEEGKIGNNEQENKIEFDVEEINYFDL